MPRLIAGALALFVLSASYAAAARDYMLGQIGIGQPWARASVTATGGAYVTIVNRGAAPDRLIGASTPRADKAELHEHVMQGSVMQMRPVTGIPLAPGSAVALSPGGYHIMLIGLKQPLKTGETFPLSLVFGRAGTIEIDVPVLTAGASGPAPESHSMPDMDGHSMGGKK
ncbi:MAG TPA: copper chaperone PCu(A)C [Candidatus Cybelea sp.]|nr:copper chaperone PCu(A)C [Candidatus Cybelea sp.]